ncbi:MAG: HlyC/CorC family transporter [Lachnospiraceae bacterium]|nr:HlyC/CorC family transporter [Lachnospiraceae bacterium]
MDGDSWVYLLFAIVVIALGAIYMGVFVAKRKSMGGKGIHRGPFEDDDDDVTEDEIISMVNESHEQGNILASEAEMIHNIFELGEKDARDIMNHRTNICAVDGDTTLEEAFDFMLNQSYSRFPVYEKNIDNIKGIIHIKDAMIYYRNRENRSVPVKDLKGLVRDVSFIPETRDINLLFKKMQSTKQHMVIVVDEYGQTAGIVAMEDILEEIVGNIEDEYDNEPDLIVKKNDGSFVMSGMTPLEDVYEALGLEMEDDPDYDTLNGLLVAALDRIPESNENPVITLKGYDFKVKSIENKIIKEVEITKSTREQD